MSNPSATQVEGRMSEYWNALPEWAKHAYHNDVEFNRIVKEAAVKMMAVQELPWELARVFHKAKVDAFEEKMLLAKSNPTSPVIA